MNIRTATIEDSDFLFNLRNEPEVCAASKNSAPVSSAIHQKWFTETLRSPSRGLYVLEDVVPVGQVRYDILNHTEAEVNIAVSNLHYGKGYATQGLQETAKLFLKDYPRTKTIIAHIKPYNIGSIKAFGKSGYVHVGSVDIAGDPYIKMTYEKRV